MVVKTMSWLLAIFGFRVSTYHLCLDGECHKLPIFANGFYIPPMSKDGDWGMVFRSIPVEVSHGVCSDGRNSTSGKPVKRSPNKCNWDDVDRSLWIHMDCIHVFF